MVRISKIGKAALLSAVLGIGVIGCESNSRDEVPSSATMSTEGSGKLSTRAPRDGVVYVKDVDSGDLVYTGRVLRDDLVTIDPNHHRVMVADKEVRTSDIGAKDRYRIYFDTDRNYDRNHNHDLDR